MALVLTSMPFTVGAEDWVVARTVELPGDSPVRRQIRKPNDPLHAVEVDDRDNVPVNGTERATAKCGAEVWLFRENWPEAAPVDLRCAACDELAK